ncbi:hypothetical protein FLACHUCJ7_00231 [Flavobacterium chungangense]|uniref:Uncharacterized protein n=1 Tax=Flavobacterium chungangense TaxID=554283 RepID=A0A6V6YND4_9FLAO|nr:hypothetical protein FLACHUCJ7_00231 [Flavobacterium chungangense]
MVLVGEELTATSADPVPEQTTGDGETVISKSSGGDATKMFWCRL